MRLTVKEVTKIKNGFGYNHRDVMNLCDTIESQRKVIDTYARGNCRDVQEDTLNVV